MAKMKTRKDLDAQQDKKQQSLKKVLVANKTGKVVKADKTKKLSIVIEPLDSSLIKSMLSEQIANKDQQKTSPQTYTRVLRSRKITSATKDETDDRHIKTSLKPPKPVDEKTVKKAGSRSTEQDVEVIDPNPPEESQANIITAVDTKRTTRRGKLVETSEKAREIKSLKAPETKIAGTMPLRGRLRNKVTTQVQSLEDSKKEKNLAASGNQRPKRACKVNDQASTTGFKKKSSRKATLGESGSKKETGKSTLETAKVASQSSKSGGENEVFPALKSFSIILTRCEAQPDVSPKITSKEATPKRNLRSRKAQIAEVAKKEKKSKISKEVNASEEKAATSQPKTSTMARVKESKNLVQLQEGKNREQPSTVAALKGPSAVCPIEPNPIQLPSPSANTSSPKVSPTLRFKIASQPEEKEEDPYSFEMSQTEVAGKKTLKKARKPRVRQKPGNKMDLLMKQQELEAVEYSCNVRNNPLLFKDQRINIEKQLNKQIESVPKVNVNHNPSMIPKGVEAKIVYSKVWHSPQQADTAKANDPQPGSDSITTFADLPLKMVQAITRNQPSTQAATPFRVPGNLPSAFYMGLSRNDGTPTFSSDLVAGGGDQTVTHTESSCTEVTPQISQPDDSETCVDVQSQPPSFLEDSNSENIQPAGCKSPSKKIALKSNRSPFKPLPLGSSSMFLNKTGENTILEEAWEDDAADMMIACEQAEKEYLRAKQTQNSAKAQTKSTLDDTFGFDDLLEGGQNVPEILATSHSPVQQDNIHKKLQDMKRFLPSNKNRGLQFVPASPVKALKILSSPSKSTKATVRQFFTASTPVTRRTEASNSKSNQQMFVTSPELSAVEESVANLAESKIALFEDSSELHNTKRIYSRNRPATNVDEVGKPAAVKPAKKKFNIEETGAFKKFVHDKSNEFAEVDEYDMIIE